MAFTVAAIAGCTVDPAAGCVTSVALVNERAEISVELTEASAQSQLGGRVIALFATDYDQEGLTGLGRQPELAPDGNLLWLDVGDPRGESGPLTLGPGDVVEFGAGDPPITASHWTPTRIDTFFGNATGTVTVRQLTDTVCVDLDLTSDEFTVTGTVTAPLDVAP